MSISKDFPCSNCGAKRIFDAELQSMKCPYCKTSTPQFGWDIPIEEGIKMAARGFGTPVSQFDCTECGAIVNVAANEQTAKCIFCGSVKVLAREASGAPITPKAIVPFKLDKKQAGARFNKWITGLWFRPNDLKKLAKVQNMDGVYIPYWVFDTAVQSRWTAESGYRYTETEWYRDLDGKSQRREVEKIRWETSYGDRKDYINGYLICASKGLPPDLIEKLKSFDINKLVPYQPGFLAGWQAESYVIDLLPAWTKAQQEIINSQEVRCSSDVPGDEQRHLSVRNNFSNVSFKHVLLPVWISTYRYGGKPYQFLVNGQTGEVQGVAPWSVAKITATVIAIVAGIFGIIYAQNQRY
jgi:DNA-directed RNA polymerase subunit RPC12/RpoP